jgi:uncharacterized phage protein gp47/JayE
MPFSRPQLSELILRAEADFETRLEGADARLRRSGLSVIARAHSGAVHGLYDFLSFIARQVMIDTAETEFLERWAGVWGVPRKAASFAEGPVVFTGQAGVNVPAGTQARFSTAIVYETIAPVTLDAGGTAIATARALLPGRDGNIEEGRSLSLAAPVEGVDSAVTAGVDGLTGGADEEDDDSLRRRLLDRIQMPPAGGAAFDYERWALEVPGVTRAWVSSREMGEGSVTVRFMMDDTYPDGIPQAADEQAVFDHVYPLRPVTAELFVAAPIAVPLTFQIQGLVPATQAVRDAVAAELADLIRREAVPAGALLISHVREAISIAAGEFDHRLLDPTANVAHGVGEIATFGGVTWS